ncbi:MAG: hypothetical protein KDJ31_02520 [Candidatus Competibacteraceae bacterium]|nr:hypothetical protein [Candidatus Competibacteraceae bacterium]MCB1822422.1 hypothetical protein [Candidatus Competibacteraceae bacterium]
MKQARCSIPALLIADGIILFVFALHLVLGEDKDESKVLERLFLMALAIAYGVTVHSLLAPLVKSHDR